MEIIRELFKFYLVDFLVGRGISPIMLILFSPFVRPLNPWQDKNSSKMSSFSPIFLVLLVNLMAFF